MAITFTGTGGLFKRLGYLGGVAGVGTNLSNPDVNYYRGTIVKSKVDTLQSAFAESPSQMDVFNGLYSKWDGWVSSNDAFLAQIQAIFQSLIIETAYDDASISPKTLETAIDELNKQLTSQAYYVTPNVVAAGSQTTVGSPTGTPLIVMSVKGPEGKSRENLFAETLKFRCTNDSQQTATIRQEEFTITGANAVANSLSYLWPGGSGINKRMNLADPTMSAAGGNLLYNSAFGTFTTANHPDNWNIVTGAAGTTIKNGSSSNAYFSGGSPTPQSLEFLSDGSTLMNVTQEFNKAPSTSINSGGTSSRLKAKTQYNLVMMHKLSSATSAGVLVIDLIDGSNNVIADDQSANNTQSITVSGLTTSWTVTRFSFRTPSTLPSTIKLRIRLTTSHDNTDSLYMNIAMKEAEELYVGGPYCTIFAGATNCILGDHSNNYTIAMTNDRAGYFQTLVDRMCGMRGMRKQLISAGTTLINNNLIA